MSWSRALYQTYENCSRAPVIDREHEDAVPLPPLFHDLKRIEIELAVDAKGNFKPGSAMWIGEKNMGVECIVPTDEDSESRTGSTGDSAPLFDKLSYMAGDYDSYTDGKSKRDQYDKFIEKLGKWRHSEFWYDGLTPIFDYLEKGTLISDLVSAGVFKPNDKGRIPEKELDVKVRIYVAPVWGKKILPWESEEAWESHITYTRAQQRKADLCYVTGKIEPLASSHPKIGGNGKLISSNQDGKGFIVNTGFLENADKALSISYESSQKIHLALKWLIKKQGYRVGDSMWLAFGTSEPSVPGIEKDSYDYIGEKIDTEEVFAARLRASIWGRKRELGGYGNIIILGTSTETTGRISLTYYNEYKEDDYLKNIEDWHKECSWRIVGRPVYGTKSNDGNKKKGSFVDYYGSASLIDIVKACYGADANDKLKKSAFARLVPCVVEGRKIPRDIMSTLALQGGNPHAYENVWEYRRVQSIACAVIRKYYNDLEGREVYKMALDLDCKDRSYLFGRWLAYAHNVEEYALYLSGGESRMTNAERYMRQFSLHPRKTCKIINNQLMYYFKKLEGRSAGRIMKEKMREILDEIGRERFTDERLSELYLLGYSSQLVYIKNNIDEIKKMKGTENENEDA